MIYKEDIERFNYTFLMQLRVIDTVKEFVAIESAWKALWKRSRSTIFQSYHLNLEAYTQLLSQKNFNLY